MKKSISAKKNIRSIAVYNSIAIFNVCERKKILQRTRESYFFHKHCTRKEIVGFFIFIFCVKQAKFVCFTQKIKKREMIAFCKKINEMLPEMIEHICLYLNHDEIYNLSMADKKMYFLTNHSLLQSIKLYMIHSLISYFPSNIEIEWDGGNLFIPNMHRYLVSMKGDDPYFTENMIVQLNILFLEEIQIEIHMTYSNYKECLIGKFKYTHHDDDKAILTSAMYKEYDTCNEIEKVFPVFFITTLLRNSYIYRQSGKLKLYLSKTIFYIAPIEDKETEYKTLRSL